MIAGLVPIDERMGPHLITRNEDRTLPSIKYCKNKISFKILEQACPPLFEGPTDYNFIRSVFSLNSKLSEKFISPYDSRCGSDEEVPKLSKGIANRRAAVKKKCTRYLLHAI